jgi:hypothetical protein
LRNRRSGLSYEQCGSEISTGPPNVPFRYGTSSSTPTKTLFRGRIERDHPIPPPFRLKYLELYAEAARTWLHGEAEVVDTTHLTGAQAALQIPEAVKS